MPATDPIVMSAFELMIQGVEGVERLGATMPYVALSGNVYATISRLGVIGILVDEEERRPFTMAGGTPFEMVRGIPLKGFGAIPESMHRDRLQLQSWFRRAHAAAEKLPPKAPSRPPRLVAETASSKL